MPTTPPDSNVQKPAEAGASRPTIRKRWTTHRFRWRVRLLLGIPVAIVLLGLLLMRSPLVGWIVGSQLRTLTGCKFKGSGAYIDVDGRLVLRAFDLVLPDVAGDAGRVLSARNAVIELDWSDVLSGKVRPTAMRLDHPVFRVSQSLDDGTINMAKVASAVQAVPTGGGGASPPAPPRIDAIDGVVVLGEHTGSGAMSILREVPMSGSFMPLESGRPVYALRIGQSGSGGGANPGGSADAARVGMIVDGKVDLSSGASALKLYNFQLDQWRPESVPSAYRELWSRLGVQGRIASASLGYDPGLGVSVELVLDDVSMTALIPAEDVVGAGDAVGSQAVVSTVPNSAGRDLGLQGVSGTIAFSPSGLNAELSGRIERQEGLSKVRLQTVGTDRNAALTCEIRSERITLSKEVGLLPYMPERAKRYLRVFGGPTGEVDAQLTILRGAPVNGQPAPVEVRDGRVVIRNGSAAFHKFPYPFSDMYGVFEFSETRLKIVEVTGRGPTGATLKASGLIEPLTDEAMVEVTLRAENLPTDEVLLGVMPPDRRKVLETIFSAKEHQRLLDSGLIRLPGAPGRSDPTSTLEPEFPLGGRCDIDIHVVSPRGKDSPWFTTVDVAFAEAGVVPEPFPLPVLVRGLKMHITDESAQITAGHFIPIAGGTMDVSVKVLFEEDGKSVSKPDVRISAQQVPIDRTLMHALPASLRPGATPPSDPSMREAQVGELIRRLNLSGALDIDARIMAADVPVEPGETPDIDYRVEVDLSRCVLTPSLYAEDPAFSIENLRGKMEITPRVLRMFPLSADLVRTRGEESEFVGPPACASFAIRLETLLEKAGADAGRMDGSVAISRIDLTEPVERLVSVFSPQAGIKLGELRTQRRPSGRLNTTLSLYREPGVAKPTSVALTLDNASNIEVEALSGRLGVDWPEGVIGVALPGDGPESLSFEGVQARLTLDGRFCGDLMLSGPLTLDNDRNTVAGPADLRAEFSGWSFESPLIEPVLKAFTGERTTEQFRSLHAAGLFDATLSVGTDGPIVAGVAPAVLEVELRPTKLAFDRGGKRIVLNEVEGAITLRTSAGVEPAPVTGRFDSVRVRAPAWTAHADGTWSALAAVRMGQPGQGEGQRPVKLDLRFGVEAQQLTPDLRALLPGSARQAIDGLDAEFRGPLNLTNAMVKTDAAGDEAGQTSFMGELRFEDLAFNVGVPIAECEGSVRMDIQTRPAEAGGPSVRVDFESAELRAAGVLVRSAQASVVSSEKPGVIEAPSITAQCHGGRVTARATVTLAGATQTETHAGAADEGSGEGGGRPRYEAQVLLAGVRLAPVLSDFAAAGATDPGPVGPPNPFTEPDPSRGKIDARLTVRGVAGALNSRTGEGVIRISEGDVLRLPVMLPLIQVSNLQLPSKDRLSYMQSQFSIDGPAADFHQISLLSDSIAIVGQGTLTWPQLNLNMRFTSKGRARVPVLSDLFDLLRDEIVSTTVSGKLAEPIVRVEPFTGTRQMLEDLFNPNKRQSRGDLGAAGKAARQEMDRLNESAGAGTSQEDEP